MSQETSESSLNPALESPALKCVPVGASYFFFSLRLRPKNKYFFSLHQKNNIKLVEKAVKGMLPKNKLGAELYRNLKVFPGSDHNHEAQKPKVIDVNSKI